MIKLLRKIEQGLPNRMIYCDQGVQYLFRAKIAGYMPGGNRDAKFNLYLHDFRRDDLDRHLHDHPFRWSVSLILSGGYEEERWVGGTLVDGKMIGGQIQTRFVAPGTLNFLMPGDFHRVTKLYGEVHTLFAAGPRFNDWGFLINRNFVPHKQFHKENGR